MSNGNRDLELQLRLQAKSEGKGEVAGLAAEVRQLGGDASAAEAKAAELDNTLRQAARQGELIERVRELRGELEGQSRASSEAKDQATALGRAKGEAAKEAATLAGRVTALSQQLDQERAAVAATRERLRELKEEKRATKTPTDALLTSIKETEAQLKSETTAVATSTKALGELKNESRAAEAELRRREKALAAGAKEAKAEAEAEQALRLALQDTRKELSANGVDVTRLASEQVRLRQQTNASQAAFAELATGLRDQISASKQSADAAAANSAAQRQAFANLTAGIAQAAQEAIRQQEAQAANARKLEEAYRSLGVESSGSLQAAATSARSSFDLIQKSGTASARQLDQAFEAVAAAELRVAQAAGSTQVTVTAANLRAKASTDDQRAAVERLIRDLDRSGNTGRAAGSEISAGYRQAAQAVRVTGDEAEKAGHKIDAGARAIKAGIAAFVSIQSARELIELADAVQLVESRLRLVTNSASELASAQAGLLEIAQRTRQSYEGTAELFVTIARSAETLKLSQVQLLEITEVIQQAVKVSGASATSAQAALVQLGQGLQSGTLRGEELNSILEQTPRIAKALADGLDVPIGALRKMGEEGELTAERVIKALQSQRKAIEEEYAKIQPTVADTWTTARNNFQQYISEVNKQSGTTSAVGKFFSGFGGIFESFAINLEMARKAQEAQEVQLYRTGTAAMESEQRIRALLGAQGEASEASKKLDADLEVLRTMMADRLAGGAQASIKEIEKLKEGLTDAGALSKLSADDLASFADKSVDLFAAAEKEMASLRAEFPALQNVSTEALAAIDGRFAEVQKRIDATGEVLGAIREEQFKRLGIDAGEVLVGIDAKAKTLLATFQSLAKDESISPKIITAAYKELLKTLDSPAELTSLRDSLKDVKVKGFESAEAIAEVEKKLKEVEAAADPMRKAVEEAFKVLGVSSQASLQLTADKAKEAFETIRKSGIATAGDLETAFEAYAETALKAAAAQSQSALEAEKNSLLAKAATDEQRKALEALIARYEEKGAASRTASKDATDGLAEELSAVEAVNAAYERRLRTVQDINKLVQQTSGGGFSMDSIDPRSRAVSGDDRTALEILFQRLSAAEVQAQRNGTSTNGRGIEEKFSDAVSTFLKGGAEAERLRADLLGIQAPLGSRPAEQSAASDTQKERRTTEVIVNLNGQRFRGLYEATEGERFVRELESLGGVTP